MAWMTASSKVDGRPVSSDPPAPVWGAVGAPRRGEPVLSLLAVNEGPKKASVTFVWGQGGAVFRIGFHAHEAAA
eukprot:1661471-Alexandrium_andersonii.AAC.1